MPEQQGELKERKMKTNPIITAQVSITSQWYILKFVSRRSFLLHWASLPFQLRGQEKARVAMKAMLPLMIAGQSSWKGLSSDCQVRVCAELESTRCPCSTPTGACIEVIFSWWNSRQSSLETSRWNFLKIEETITFFSLWSHGAIKIRSQLSFPTLDRAYRW